MGTDPASDARARALTSLGSLSALPSPELQRVCRIAAHLAAQRGRTPIAAIHLLDQTYQHRVASTGAPMERASAAQSMCLPVVREGRSVYCPDATADARYAGNPNTRGEGGVRLFYATPLRRSDGTTVGTLCVFDSEPGALSAAQRDRLQDLAQQTTAHIELTGLSRDLADLAVRDPLTMVANRFLLSHRLELALADPDRAPHEPALIVVDLDGFKRVNDRYGHIVGDEVLSATAARLVASVRPDDLVARLGGDEFAVLFDRLPDPSLVAEVAERIAAVTAQPYETKTGPLVCRASVGYTLGRPGDFPYELMGRADAQMYERKAAGSRTIHLPRQPSDVTATPRR